MLPKDKRLLLRRRRASTASIVALNDIQTLAAAVPGLLGIYDVRYGMHTTGAVFNSIDDARGAAGYGPNIPGTASPAWDSTNKLITLNGTTQYLSSPINAAFDLSLGRTFLYIGTIPSSGYPFAASDAGITKYLALNSQGATLSVAGSIANITMASPVDTNRRLGFFSVSTNSPYGAVTPTGVQVVGGIVGRVGKGRQFIADSNGAITSGSFQMWIGKLSTYMTANVIRAALVLDHPITGVELGIIKAWAAANHAVVSDDTITRMIAFDGNSIVIGAGAPAGSDFPALLMAQTGFTTNMDYANGGISSRTGAVQLASFQTRIAPLFQGNHTKKGFVTWEGINDINNGVSAVNAAKNLTDMCALAKAAGATFCAVVTTLPSLGLTGAAETARLAMNVILRASVGTSGVDAVVDAAAISQLSDPNNVTYYADGTHPTAAGNGVINTDPTYGMKAVLTPFI